MTQEGSKWMSNEEVVQADHAKEVGAGYYGIELILYADVSVESARRGWVEEVFHPS